MKNLFDPDKENFNDTKRLNSKPKILIAAILAALLTLLLIVILSAESKSDIVQEKQSLEVVKKDSAYNSDDDFIKNLATRSKQNNQESEEVEDFREVLISQSLPFSSREEPQDNKEKKKELDLLYMPIPISMLGDIITVIDRSDTYTSVNLTTSEIVAFRQKRIDELDTALKSSIRVFSGNNSPRNTASASASVSATASTTIASASTINSSPTTSNIGSKAMENNQMSYQEQLQEALIVTKANASSVSNENNKWTLKSSLEKSNPYTIKTGSIIPATLITQINSSVQGQITGQVRNNVYDTATGNQLLIPQGTRLIGTYASEVPYGQSRLFIAWNRLVFPNGASMDIETMPGVDMTGKAGFNDKVNNHYLRIFGNALLLSLIVAGVNVSQSDLLNNFVPSYLESSSSAISESLGQNLGETMSQMVRKNLNIAPELTIRPGYLFNIMVVKDITLPIYK